MRIVIMLWLTLFLLASSQEIISERDSTGTVNQLFLIMSTKIDTADTQVQITDSLDSAERMMKSQKRTMQMIEEIDSILAQQDSIKKQEVKIDTLESVKSNQKEEDK